MPIAQKPMTQPAQHKGHVEILRPLGVRHELMRITTMPLSEVDTQFSNTMEALRKNPGLIEGDIVNFTVVGVRANFTQSYRWRESRPEFPTRYEQLPGAFFVEVLDKPIHLP